MPHKHSSPLHGNGAARDAQSQGQYLAYLHLYCKLHQLAPTPTEMARYFGESPGDVERRLAELEQLGLIERERGTWRTLRIQVPSSALPDLAAGSRAARTGEGASGPCRAEVVSIGDELTSGVRLDTNSQWLSQQLEQVGVRVWYHTTVGDEIDALVSVICNAVERVPLVILNGGLGPTADDLTREALAAVVGRPLVSDPAVANHIRDLFARRGRVMPERNLVQAQFPEGSHVLANPHGTAPGLHIEVPTNGLGTVSHLFALPGVPAELRQMWAQSVAPRVAELQGQDHRQVCHRVLRCFGAGESDIEQRLPNLVRRGRDPSVGITASHGTISLRVTAEGPSSAECHAKMDATIATIYQCLGTLVFGEAQDTLQEVVARLLGRQNRNLATAEGGTEGLLAYWLASTLNHQTYRGGFVTGPDAAGEHAFAEPVPRLAADTHARELAVSMASRAREQFGAELGLAVGPAPPRDPAVGDPGQIHFALVTPRQRVTGSSVFAAHPAIQREIAAKKALDLTRHWLLKQADERER
ncbi:MAG: CinA family nicotinamide mononucleotide deamidase-related protein [Planctomycetota bacterium]